MLIVDPDVKKTVHEYDITFDNGITIPVTVDAEAGDTFSETEQEVNIFLEAKPSKADRNKILPAENIRAFKNKVIVIQHRVREINPLSPEQQEAWDQTLESLSRH